MVYMEIDARLNGILKCPITKASLIKISPPEIENVNQLISQGELVHFDGSFVRRKITAAFVSENGQFLYPVEDGIVILLQSLAIVLELDNIKQSEQLNTEKKVVQAFYEQVGWEKGEQGAFVDAIMFEDLRSVVEEYVHKCHLRVNKYLKAGGEYLLDVASGPIQYPEYLSYSANYTTRICVDISFTALKEAKKKIGEQGIFLLADITNLPLIDNLADGVVSLHTVYHVPAEEQKKALEEIHRVLKPGHSAVVVYSWGSRSLLMNIMLLPVKLFRAFIIAIREEGTASSIPSLYFYTHPYKYFNKTCGFEMEILVWRSVSVLFTKTFIHSWLWGKQIMDLIYRLENEFSGLAGRIGQYPLFVINKEN